MSRIEGHLLMLTVVQCKNLKQAERLSKQDDQLYVCVEYGSTKFRSRTCTDGGNNTVIDDKFVLVLADGLMEVNVSVFNRSSEGFIGTARVDLYKVLSVGYDASVWPIFDASGKMTGGVDLELHCPNAPQNMIVDHSYPADPLYPSKSAYPPSNYQQYPGHQRAPDYLQYHGVEDDMVMSIAAERGLKRPRSLQINCYDNDVSTRRKSVRTDAEAGNQLELCSPEQDNEKHESVSSAISTSMDEEMEMPSGNRVPSPPYTIWDTIQF